MACPATPRQGVAVGGSTVRTRQIDTEVAPGSRYCYAVFAVDSSGNYSRAALDQGVRTPAVVTTPKPVTGLTATADGSNVVLSWQNPVNAGLAFIAVRRGPANDCPTGPLAGTGIGSQQVRTSQTDTTATPGTAYCYRVFALNSIDSAAATTTEANITTHKPPPPPESHPAAAPSSGSGWLTSTLTHAVAGIAMTMLLLMAVATALTRRRLHTSAYVTPRDIGPRVAISGYTPVALVIPALLILGSCAAIVLVLINL